MREEAITDRIRLQEERKAEIAFMREERMRERI
jgi:hypothetical protein